MNPIICVAGVSRPATDAELAQLQADQSAHQAARAAEAAAATAALMQRWVIENTYINAIGAIRRLVGQTVAAGAYAPLSDTEFPATVALVQARTDLTLQMVSQLSFAVNTSAYTLDKIEAAGCPWEAICWHPEVAAQTIPIAPSA